MALREDILKELQAYGAEGVRLVNSFVRNRDGFLHSSQHPSEITAYLGDQLAEVVGALKALRTALDRDLIDTLETKVREEIHIRFIKDGLSLLKGNEARAAMVLGCAVLEDHLRKMCATRKLHVTGTGIAAYNVELFKVEAYPLRDKTRIDSIGQHRNECAHSMENVIKKADVEDDLKRIRKLIADYPS